jgi:hypothetical protein
MPPIADLRVKKRKFPDPVWDGPGKRIRRVVIREKERYAVYAVEMPEGPRTISYGHTPYRLFFPWHYFFIKVRWLEAPAVPSDAGAYVFFAKRRAESIDDKVLCLPFLPHLFDEAGICLEHMRLFSRKTAKETLADFVRWFYRSNGSTLFESYWPKGHEENFSFGQWAAMSEEEAKALQWQKATYPSIREAAENLNFNYWQRSRPYQRVDL